MQFGQIAGFPHSSHSFLKLIWFSCVWTIQNERNNRIFNNKEMDMHHMLDKVKLQSFLWLKTKMPSILIGGVTLYLIQASLCNFFSWLVCRADFLSWNFCINSLSYFSTPCAGQVTCAFLIYPIFASANFFWQTYQKIFIARNINI